MARHKKQRQAPKPAARHPEASTERASAVPASGDAWVRLRLDCELLSDAHPGSGSGGGGVDALVARDRHGRPVIWASHVEGVLRDAARRLSGAEQAGDFFGRAGGQQQRAVFTSLFATSDRGARIWRSTAREAFDNRAPKDDTLRVVEHVPKGTRFEGHVELPASDVPLLRRLLAEVDALGRGRATGAGRVRLTATEAPPPGRTVGPATGRLVLLLRNLEPLCITATATPDNLIPSLAFIPGRTLLGALAGWLIGTGHRDAAAMLVGGAISVSDALPVPQPPERLSEAEVLPAPLSLQSAKPSGTTGEVPWWAQAPEVVRRVDGSVSEAKGMKLKRPEADLFVFRPQPEAPWQAYRPELRVRLRNGRPDPGQADPSLFAIEQIVEQTAFLCELRGDPTFMAKIAKALEPVLAGRRWLRVGRAGAPVEVAKMAWSKAPKPITTTPAMILTLTSDLLVRDELLRWCTSVDQARLSQLPGWPATVHVSPIMQDRASIHGFNGTARLWRMPAAGVRRGSVFRVEGDGVRELAERAARGDWLGERTHEGHGRFRLDEVLPGVGEPTATSLPAAVADDPQDVIAATTRSWFEARRGLCHTGSSTDRRPSLSQWLDLVAALERRDADALTSRLHPTTAGARAWSHRDAAAILNELAATPAGVRADHARCFVRWLRAEMRRRAA